MHADPLETAPRVEGDIGDGRLGYEVVDVFTARAFAGNPLAVVYGADRLSSEQMLSLATEFNLSETAFPLALTPADREAGADYRVRIFTPGGEVPFAGHPTLGTAWALRARGDIGGGDVTQACGAGLIAVHLPSDHTRPVALSAVARDAARELTPTEVADVVPLVGLTVDDVAGPAHVAGCGLTWLYLRVSPEAVSRARPSSTRLCEVSLNQSALTDPLDGIDVYAVAARPAAAGDDLQVFSRVFVPGLGIPEDPATGSAAVGLGLALVAAGLAAADGQTSYRIEQGVEMGRPSLLIGRVEASNGLGRRAHVAGRVVPIATGTIAVPPLP
ncbi:MAG: PhzF family phenazine biosynthesis protein [Propionibacteriales bacterium]|nr:PhzF family phenazine biosynthesis protein [Propionibacteriales bacterium]